MASTKRYEARIHLGVETETYDAEGAIVAETDASHLTLDDVERALPAFARAIDQLPPIYSDGFFGLVAALLSLSVTPLGVLVASAGAILLLLAALRRDRF